MTVSDVGGKGKKQCPSCNKYIGGRAATCPNCNHSFHVKSAPKVEEHEEISAGSEGHTSYSMGGQSRVTHTPTGNCPCRITGTDADSVREWAERTRAAWGEAEHSHLSLAGLEYWVRHTYPCHTPEYKECIRHLREIYA